MNVQTNITDNNDDEGIIIIQGKTAAGGHFRPSDWAERVCGKLSTFRNRRMVYSPLLQPTVKDGYSCLKIDSALKKSNPRLFQSIIEFAQNNKLTISKDNDTPEN